MIKYNNSDIKDWNYGTSNIVKVYHNNAICFYKVTESHSQTPCYAVVDNISQYQETEFEDVYDKATEKWYKLNNLNQYEEYGLYGSGRNITYYEGKLTIDDGYEYQYSGGSWVNIGEVSGSTATLPDVPFTVNYNAKNYNSTTKTFAKTSGQLADMDVTITQGTPTPHDTYVTVASGTRGVISGYGTYFNRTNNTPELTIISKQRTDGSSCHLFANRTTNYNWMYRAYNNKLTLHGTSELGSIAVTTQPVIESVRVDSNRIATYNNYTNNTSSTKTSFSYGSANGDVALFAGFTSGNSEWFVGDFYWIYMSQTKLTDAQVQQVIDYNEGGGGDEEYPEYYEDKQEPPTMVTFNSMEEALAYACPYVGLRAKIGGDNYVFNDQYQWEYTPLPYDAEVQYLENDGTQYINTNAYVDTSNFEIGFTTNGTDSVFGYVHQGMGNGTWIGSEKTNMFFGKFSNQYIVSMSSYLTSNENTIVFTKNGVTVNGTTISNSFSMGSDSIANNPLLFFARWDFNKKAVEFVGNTHFKFKSFYLKNNGSLVVDMIAVRVGQVGYMYDRVSQQLFPNAGSGNFIVGSDIN